jgi:uncharacterized protein with HEPN domain
MSRSDLDRLKDIVHSADLAARHAGNLDAVALSAADPLRDAALFRIAVIGEAASRLPAEIQALAPEIPWNLVKNMRNHIVHGYWQIDFHIVAETIALDLEPLKATAKRLIQLIERTDG